MRAPKNVPGSEWKRGELKREHWERLPASIADDHIGQRQAGRVPQTAYLYPLARPNNPLEAGSSAGLTAVKVGQCDTLPQEARCKSIQQA